MTVYFYKCLSCGVNFSKVITYNDSIKNVKCPYCNSSKIDHRYWKERKGGN